jgi:hypothetical protein
MLRLFSIEDLTLRITQTDDLTRFRGATVRAATPIKPIRIDEHQFQLGDAP